MTSLGKRNKKRKTFSITFQRQIQRSIIKRYNDVDCLLDILQPLSSTLLKHF